jgi:general secretion pathway protein H
VIRPRAGFTLVELAVVLLILTLAISIILPRLPGPSEARQKEALRRLAGSVAATYEEALYQKRSLAIYYLIQENSYHSAEWDDELGDYNPEADRLPVKETHLPEGLRFRDVEVPHLEGAAFVDPDRPYTPFLPQGYAHPTWIHLEDEDGDSYTIVVHPLLGRAEILDGRVEAE